MPRSTRLLTLGSLGLAATLLTSGCAARKVATFSALGYALMHGDHIRVTLLSERLSPAAQRVLQMAGALVGIGLTALLAWRTGVMALDSFRNGTFSIAGSGLPLWPVHAFVPLGFVVLLVQLLALLASDLAALGRGAR